MTTPGLNAALELSRRMLEAAKAEAWPQLLELEATREPLLTQSFTDPDDRAGLEQILSYDQQLRELVGQARDQAAEQWQQEVDRSRAISAYAQP